MFKYCNQKKAECVFYKSINSLSSLDPSVKHFFYLNETTFEIFGVSAIQCQNGQKTLSASILNFYINCLFQVMYKAQTFGAQYSFGPRM